MLFHKVKFYFIIIFTFTFSTSTKLFSQEQVENGSNFFEDTSIQKPDSTIQEPDVFLFEDSVSVSDTLPEDTVFIIDRKLLEFFVSRFGQNPVEPAVTYPDTLILNEFRLPFIFYGYIWEPVSLMPEVSDFEKPLFPDNLFPNKLFADVYRKNDLYKDTYRNIVSNHKYLISYTKKKVPSKTETLEGLELSIEKNPFTVEYDNIITDTDKPGRFIPKRRYWINNGSSYISFTQNYFSDNWLGKGATGNMNLLSVHKFSANYKKNRIEFNNLFEWELSLFTNPNDTLRATRIGKDLFRYYSNFGVKAVQNWSYSTNIEVKTQLFRNFKENSNIFTSSALSPVYINMGILGMKYDKTKNFPKIKGKNLKLSIDLSPLSLQYTYVLSDSVDIKRFGIQEGRKHQTDFGSSVNATFVMNFNKNVRFSSRFKYFSNYEKVILESENELNMPINRFFSTRLYLYFRFDDSKGIIKDSKFGYIQLNELLSFGFNYSW